MPNRYINENILYNIADAVRNKLGTDTTYKPSQIPNAINSIPTGYPEPTGTVAINSNGSHNVKNYETANVNVPNTYSASDEGKVVSSGALVAQSSQNITQNGTYDTTLKNEVVVNVSSGGGGSISVLINEEEYQTDGGAISIEETLTIQEEGEYLIYAGGYLDTMNVKINNVSQSPTFSYSARFVYFYNNLVYLNVGDSIYIDMDGTGRTYLRAFVIKMS